MYLVSLSEQQLADYSKHNSGCNDGLMDPFLASVANNEAGYMGNHIHWWDRVCDGNLERIHWWDRVCDGTRNEGTQR